ncbi:MAG TPA: endonuclease domain-containing protein [Balneolaceae bacterium]
MERLPMFYGAPPHIFEKARELRKTMTEAENVLWERLKKKQLGYRFRRQHPLSEFIADFYCHAAKLVIEVEGCIHELEKQKDYDLERTKELESFGITVLRFTNEQVENEIEDVLNNIKLYLNCKTFQTDP